MNYLNTNRTSLKIFFIIFTMLFFLSILLLSFITFNTNNFIGNQIVFLWSWVNNIVLIYIFISWYCCSNKLIHPYIVFFLVLFVFTSGQIVLYSIGLYYKNFNLLSIYKNEILVRAIIFNILCYLALHIGVLVGELNNITKFQEYHKYKLDDINLIKCIKIILIPIFLISGAVYFEDLITKAILSLRNGYISLYNQNKTESNLLYPLRMFFIPTLFALLVFLKDNKLYKYGMNMLLLCIITLSFLMGSRTEGVIVVLCYLLITHIFIKPFRNKKILSLIIPLLIIFSFIPVIAEFRNISEKSFSTFVDLYFATVVEDSVFVSILGELGGSLFPLLNVIELQPNVEQFNFGQTYLAALTSFLPSILVGSYLANIRISLAEWLQERLHLDYGPGFSVVAEAYYNFGILGWIFFIFLGLFISFTFKLNFKSNIKFFLSTVLLIAGIYFLLLIVRDQFLLFFRNYILCAIIPSLMVIFLYRNTKYLKGKKND